MVAVMAYKNESFTKRILVCIKKNWIFIAIAIFVLFLQYLIAK